MQIIISKRIEVRFFFKKLNYKMQSVILKAI